jgi:hypothetical protein
MRILGLSWCVYRLPSDAFGWLYACRGLYQLQEYSLVVEGLSHCLRHEKTAKESQHLLAFSLLHTKQNKLAAAAFFKSIKLGNETDWQPLVEVRHEEETDTHGQIRGVCGSA